MSDYTRTRRLLMNGIAIALVMAHELFCEYINNHQHNLSEKARMQAHEDAATVFWEKLFWVHSFVS